MPALRPSSTRRQGLIRLAACAASLFLVFAGMNIGAAVAAPAAPEAPVIHCAWALASVGTSATFEYGPDDDTTTPLFGAGAPCASDPTGVASQPTGAQGMLHVQPNPTAPRELELWAAVSYPTSDAFASGDGAVAWIIHRPNGRELARVEPTGRSCAGTTAPGPMWTAASTTDSGTGAFSMETVTNVAGSGLWQACRQGQIRAFFGRLSLPADAACGSYPVTTSATVDGETSTLDYSIEVLCPLMVNLDTTEIRRSAKSRASPDCRRMRTAGSPVRRPLSVPASPYRSTSWSTLPPVLRPANIPEVFM